jgi:hypothetical protein
MHTTTVDQNKGLKEDGDRALRNDVLGKEFSGIYDSYGSSRKAGYGTR